MTFTKHEQEITDSRVAEHLRELDMSVVRLTGIAIAGQRSLRSFRTRNETSQEPTQKLRTFTYPASPGQAKSGCMTRAESETEETKSEKPVRFYQI